MTDRELVSKIFDDIDFEKKAAQKVSDQIDEELAKKNPDYDKIAELSDQYCELMDIDDEIHSHADEHYRMIIETAKKKKPFVHLLRTFSFVAASIIVFMFSVNCVTVAAFNMNIFKTIVHYAKGGFTVDFNGTASEDDDPYGIKAECAKQGIYPEAPTYLPEGFELESVISDDFGVCDDIIFRYTKENMYIIIDYQLYHKIDDMKYTHYPSDHYNIEEISVNGRTAITSKEDDQYTLVYAKDNLLLTIFTRRVPYEECDKITGSIK